jgi:hypothetical protein
MCMMCLERNCDRSTKGKKTFFNLITTLSLVPPHLTCSPSPLLSSYACTHTQKVKYIWMKRNFYYYTKRSANRHTIPSTSLGCYSSHRWVSPLPPPPQVCGSWNHMFVVGLGKDNVWVNDKRHTKVAMLYQHMGNSLKKALKLSRLVS